MKYIYILTLFSALFTSGFALAENDGSDNGLCVDASTEMSGPEDPVTLNVFPNPATSYIEVNSSSEIDEIVIFNTLGAIVYKEKGNGSVARININDLPKGVYLLRCNGTTKRFVKK